MAVSRAGIRLAFVAALQYLSARQRAVLILRDVLEWPAAQVADLLGTTTTAVNSGLRRARAQLARALPVEDELAEPAEPETRALLDRFAAAIENADASALAVAAGPGCRAGDAPGADVVHRPPGRGALHRVELSHRARAGAAGSGDRRMAQPAFAVYQREPGGAYRAHAVQVLTVTASGIARIVAFADPALFTSFGLPQEYDGAAAGPTPAQDPAVARGLAGTRTRNG